MVQKIGRRGPKAQKNGVGSTRRPGGSADFKNIIFKKTSKVTSKLATRRLCTNLLTINGIWDRIFCELGIDGLSWSACNGSTKI